MSYDLNEFVDRNGTDSVKWEFMQLIDPDVKPSTLPFWVADMDFPCAEPVLDALHKRVDRKIFGYSAHYSAEYYRAVCGWYQHRFGWFVNSSDIVYSPGVVPAVAFLIETLTKPGDGIIIQKPVYYPFSNMINSHRRTIVNNALIEKNGRYEINFDDLEAKAKDAHNKLMIFCSPHNPVGRVWTENELRKVGRICINHGVLLLSDEIHYDIVRRGIHHIPIEMLFPKKEEKAQIITATAPSKTFNLAGMQISNIIIHDPEIRKQWQAYVVDQLGLSMPNAMAITATVAAYTKGEDWLENVKGYIDSNLAYMKDFYAKRLPDVKFSPPEGTYLTWADFRAYGKTDEELLSLMSKDAQILVENGSMFGEEGSGFVRMNVACTRKMLEEGLERMAVAINRLETGRKAPDFEFDTPWHKGLRLCEVAATGPVYLWFMRYFGCTLCQLDIHKLTAQYELIAKRGAKVVIVLQSDPALIHGQVGEGELPFEIACDPDQRLYKLYEVRPAINRTEMLSLKTIKKLGESMMAGYKHGKYEGNEQQLPALFLIDTDLSLLYVKYAKNLGDLPSMEEMATILDLYKGAKKNER